MKSHSVKSNAKRAARKLCEQFPGIEVAEPVQGENGEWFPVVKATTFDADEFPEGVMMTAYVISADASFVTMANFPVNAVGLPIPEEMRRCADIFASSADFAVPAEAPAEPAALKPTSRKPVDLQALADAIPPTQSTPEEIAERRAARRARIEAEKLNPTPKTAKVNMADRMVELATRPEGATSDELQALTGWQAHTIRGYIAGTLRKRGHAFRLVKAGDRKAYHCDPVA